MMLSRAVFARLLRAETELEKKDPLVILPDPKIEASLELGGASVDLRLGSWFLLLREGRMPCAEIREDKDETSRQSLADYHYVPIGKDFYIHPGKFVLGITLEWIRLPMNIAGYLIGKSSWGRRGLIVATATGVQPGFVGSLTLELANLGQIPVEVWPGMPVCQLFLHRVEIDPDQPVPAKTSFLGQRKPAFCEIYPDVLAAKLRGASKTLQGHP